MPRLLIAVRLAEPGVDRVPTRRGVVAPAQASPVFGDVHSPRAPSPDHVIAQRPLAITSQSGTAVKPPSHGSQAGSHRTEDACRPVGARIVGCAGTEVPTDEAGRQAEEFIEARSRELFAGHLTGVAVMNYLSREEPSWYGSLEFGTLLKVPRPSLPLPVRRVEDAVPRERA